MLFPLWLELKAFKLIHCRGHIWDWKAVILSCLTLLTELISRARSLAQSTEVLLLVADSLSSTSCYVSESGRAMNSGVIVLGGMTSKKSRNVLLLRHSFLVFSVPYNIVIDYCYRIQMETFFVSKKFVFHGFVTHFELKAEPEEVLLRIEITDFLLHEKKWHKHNWCLLKFQDFAPPPRHYQIHETFLPFIINWLPPPPPGKDIIGASAQGQSSFSSALLS